MKNLNKPLWRLADLQKRAAQALASADYEGADSGRVTTIPNERTLRYYTTIGLMDRPAEMRGRTGYYAWKHVLQIVAIKRLQEGGLSLTDVQQRLVGRSVDALAAIAKLSPNPTDEDLKLKKDAPAPAEEVEAPGRSRRSGAFWTQAARRQIPTTEDHMASLSFGPAMLVWNGREASADDIAALQAAAAPLLAEMRKRGMLGADFDKNNNTTTEV